MNASNEEKKQNEKPSCPEQPSSEYDVSKPYKICVKEGNQGGAEKLCIDNFDLDTIVLEENEVLIDIHASGINFIDTYHRSGLYKNVLDIGKEGAGHIMTIGNKVNNYAVGDKVCWFEIQGSYATHAVTTCDNIGLMKIPESLFGLVYISYVLPLSSFSFLLITQKFTAQIVKRRCLMLAHR